MQFSFSAVIQGAPSIGTINRGLKRFGFVSGLAIASALCSGQAIAQESDGALEQASSDNGSANVIIVTGRKREETIVEVPVSMVSVSDKQLARQGLADLEDIAAVLPGVQFDNGISPVDFRPSIRGIQADRGRPNVGILIDDIDISSENLSQPGGGSLARIRLLDVERVEVVKGPQSALYGRSAFTGAINFITRRPSLDGLRARGSVDVNTEEAFDGRFSISAPISDNVAVGVTGFAYDERGSYRNTVSDNYIGGSDGVGGSVSVLAELGDVLTAYARVEYADESFAPPPIFLIAGTDSVDLDADGQSVTGATTGRVFSGAVTDQPIAYDVDPRTGKEYPGTDVEHFRASLILDADLGGIALKSLTSFIDNRNEIFQDNDFISGRDLVTGLTTGAFQEAEQSNVVQQFSQEIRISSNDPASRFQWMVGALYWHEDTDQVDSYDAALALGPITDSDIDAFFAFRDAQAPRLQSREIEHKSVFAWAELELADGIFTSLEGRYTNEKIDYGFSYEPLFEGFFGVISGDPPTFLSFGTNSGTDSTTINEKYFNPKAVLSYRPNSNLNLYASVAKSAKPSGYQTSGIEDFGPERRYDRETMWAYEVGAKALALDGKLGINLAAFYQDYTDQQVSTLTLDPETNIVASVVENAGKSRIWGIEAELNWTPVPEFSLSAAYTYLNAKYTEFFINTTSADSIAELGGGCFDVIGSTTPVCVQDFRGKTPLDSPEHAISVVANYNFPISDEWSFTAQQNLRYVSEQFVTNSNISTQEAYIRVDMNVGITNGQMTALVYFENLLDDDTVIDANRYLDFSSGFGPAVVGRRPDPFTAGIRLSFDF